MASGCLIYDGVKKGISRMSANTMARQMVFLLLET